MFGSSPIVPFYWDIGIDPFAFYNPFYPMQWAQNSQQGGGDPNNGGDYNGNSTSPWLRPPTGQCATILNNYQASADKINAKGWVGFWGPTMTGAAVGGGGLLTMGKAFVLGILNGAAWSFTDDSRSQINSLYNTANAQWQGAGCGSSMYNKYD